MVRGALAEMGCRWSEGRCRRWGVGGQRGVAGDGVKGGKRGVGGDEIKRGQDVGGG